MNEITQSIHGGILKPPTSVLVFNSLFAIFQLYLSRQLAQLHPELTMPMFSEICHRLQTARPSKIKCLLYYLLPWLYNMELVDGAATAANTSVSQDVPPSANVAGKQDAEQAGQLLDLSYLRLHSGIVIRNSYGRRTRQSGNCQSCKRGPRLC